MLATIAHLILRLGGWKITPHYPSEKKFLMIAAPHTALVDGFWMVVAGFAFKIRPTFLVKATYVKGLIGRVIVAVGGIPVMPGAGANKVDATIDFINQKDKIGLLLAPAGTRGKVNRWRSGFYHIARGANLPVYFSYLDYGKREVGVHPQPLWLTGEIGQDMDVLRAFYADKRGKLPDLECEIRLKEEFTP